MPSENFFEKLLNEIKSAKIAYDKNPSDLSAQKYLNGLETAYNLYTGEID